MSNLAGTVVSERYELGEILGRGGQGTVFRAHDRKTGRGVAVKMLIPGVAHNPESAVRLAREQEALVALAGTSAVAVYDLCRAPGGSLCLVMELLEGRDLERHLGELERRNERLSQERLSAIFEPIVETLERAHDAGIVHRDVKPSNIFLVADNGGVRLLDFGLSRMHSAAPLTAAGMVVGSPSYIAPEIWKGKSEDVDGRADAYSLAVILFRCLSGALPFESEALVETMRLVTTAPRPSLHALRPDLPEAVDAWATRALAVDPEARFDGVRALYDGLLTALEFTPPPRAPRPVADSLIGAWRAATSVFRRFIEAASQGAPGSATAGADADEDEEGDRPTLEFRRPPPSLPPETAAIDDAWEEVAESELQSSSPASIAAMRAAAEEPGDGDGWEEITDVEVETHARPERPRLSAPERRPNARAAERKTPNRTAAPIGRPARKKARGAGPKAVKPAAPKSRSTEDGAKLARQSPKPKKRAAAAKTKAKQAPRKNDNAVGRKKKARSGRGRR